MGDDAATSVVDRWGMTHDIANLGVIDGSVFVTAGAVNPTSTIAALALRASQHLLDQRGRIVRVSGDDGHRPSGGHRTQSAHPATVPTRKPNLIERERFSNLADVLIPGATEALSPSGLGLGGDRLDEVLVARPDLASLSTGFWPLTSPTRSSASPRFALKVMRRSAFWLWRLPVPTISIQKCARPLDTPAKSHSRHRRFLSRVRGGGSTRPHARRRRSRSARSARSGGMIACTAFRHHFERASGITLVGHFSRLKSDPGVRRENST